MANLANTATFLLSYLRVPVLASTSIAALASGLLYLKQKYPPPLPPLPTSHLTPHTLIPSLPAS